MNLSKDKAVPKVFMLDLLATVPYYTAYLSQALQANDVPVSIGSIPYYLDQECFRSRGLELTPGLLRLAAIPSLPRVVRRVLKLAEAIVNLVTLTVRFLVRPPDVLHVQFLPLLQMRMPCELVFLRLCRARGIKILLTVHDLLPHDSGDRFRSTYTELYGKMDALICHSADVRSRLVMDFRVPEQKISVIPHGPFFYDLPERNGVDDRSLAETQEPMVLWQGILHPYKGVDVLLESWKIVEAAHGMARLIVAGTGDTRLLTKVADQARQLDLKRVHLDFRFLPTDDLIALYRRADIVVYPYRAITTSGALATGLALGKAIVASDLPVFREALSGGSDALLVPASDPAALAKALLELIQHPEERMQLAARVKARAFGSKIWCEIAQQTAELYRRLVA